MQQFSRHDFVLWTSTSSGMPNVISEQVLGTIVREVKNAINSLFPAGAKPQRLGLAISGGVDSMALATLTKLARKDPTFRHTFTGFIVDHSLRDNSAEEAYSVAESLKLLDIEPDILKLDWSGHGNPRELGNFESVARTLRYQALGKACAANKIPYLMFGHHADDQAETVLSRAIHGYTGLGLQGIATTAPIPECNGIYGIDRSGSPRSSDKVEDTARMSRASLQIKRSLWRGRIAIEQGGVSIHRPLLHYTKNQLQAICHTCGTLWREDATNSDRALTVRNTIRYLQTEGLLPQALQRSRVLIAADKVRNNKQRIHHGAREMFDETPIELDLRSGRATVTISDNGQGQDCGDVPYNYHVKAAFLRKLLLLVSPGADISLQDLDQCVDMVFAPSGSLGSPPSSGLYSTPTSGVLVSRARSDEQATQWKVTLQRAVPTRSERSGKGFMQFQYHLSGWSSWLFWDNRFWIRTYESEATRDPDTTTHVAHLTPKSLGQLRSRVKNAGPDDTRHLGRFLSRVTGKERWILPAIISRSKVEDRIVSLPTLGWVDRAWHLGERQSRTRKWVIRYKDIDFPKQECHKLTSSFSARRARITEQGPSDRYGSKGSGDSILAPGP